MARGYLDTHERVDNVQLSRGQPFPGRDRLKERRDHRIYPTEMTFTSFALLSLLLAIASGGILEPDENCNRYGGICATRDSCPEVREENGKNLCPNMRKSEESVAPKFPLTLPTVRLMVARALTIQRDVTPF
ncbi:uncharacterized protein LOC111636426 [Centruroides sculpturatus]|uniref:uncharacterized protein LOC111636426 n=1 Tax=Centruroides sculpturatus TaxID=218467 RepID=UPI000C6D1169|nr:uncharacterized protein LOC111636426 [Centruroides sculpturatus]